MKKRPPSEGVNKRVLCHLHTEGREDLGNLTQIPCRLLSGALDLTPLQHCQSIPKGLG